jgi:hypothetical protein
VVVALGATGGWLTPGVSWRPPSGALGAHVRRGVPRRGTRVRGASGVSRRRPAPPRGGGPLRGDASLLLSMR